jgi:hypothetical protein
MSRSWYKGIGKPTEDHSAYAPLSAPDFARAANAAEFRGRNLEGRRNLEGQVNLINFAPA